MRIAKSQTDDRAKITLSKAIAPSDATGGIMLYGEKNDYPQIIERLILGSPTATSVANIYSKFLCGNGFKATYLDNGVEKSINDIVVGTDYRGKKIKVIDILRASAKSASCFGGAIIHVNKEVDNMVKSCTPIPFKYFRFNKVDDNGYCSQIITNPFWGERNFKKEDSKIYDLYTTDKKAFFNQVNKAGFDKYKGQVAFEFWDNSYLYPLSPFDPVYLDLDTEQQISIFKNNEIRNGFMGTTILRIADPGSEEEEAKIVAKITNSTGADGNRVLLFVDKLNEETNELQSGAFKSETITTPINDKLFESWEGSISNNIRKAAKGMPALLIDYEQGKLSGTSGEAIIQATDLFNKLTQDDRSLLSEFLQSILSQHVNENLQAVTDWTIEPLKLVDNGSTTI